MILKPIWNTQELLNSSPLKSDNLDSLFQLDFFISKITYPVELMVHFDRMCFSNKIRNTF